MPDDLRAANSRRSCVLILHAFSALFFGASTEKLAQADYTKELHRNSQLRTADQAVQDNALKQTENSVIKRLRLLRRALLWTFASMFSAVLMAILTTTTSFTVATPTPVLVIASVFCFAWATLGRLGWAGQSWKGDSSAEQLDMFIFHILYWIGMYLASVAAL